MPKAPALLDKMANAALLVALEPFMADGCAFEPLGGVPSHRIWHAERDRILLTLEVRADGTGPANLSLNANGHRIFTADFDRDGGEAVINFGERRVTTALVDKPLVSWLSSLAEAGRQSPEAAFAIGAGIAHS